LAGKMGRPDGVPALSKSVESKHVLQPMRMKTSPFTLLLALLLLAVPSTQAQQYYLNLTASYKSTNSAGALVTTKMSAPSLLIEILRDTSLGRGHSLVFDIDSGEVRVVEKTTGEIAGAWYLFTVDTAVSNLDGTRSEVYWNVTCPVDSGYQGTAVGSVQVTRGLENEITRFKMTGKFTLRYQPEDGGAPRVYTGIFTTGARYVAPNLP